MRSAPEQVPDRTWQRRPANGRRTARRRSRIKTVCRAAASACWSRGAPQYWTVGPPHRGRIRVPYQSRRARRRSLSSSVRHPLVLSAEAAAATRPAAAEPALPMTPTKPSSSPPTRHLALARRLARRQRRSCSSCWNLYHPDRRRQGDAPASGQGSTRQPLFARRQDDRVRQRPHAVGESVDRERRQDQPARLDA